MQEQRGKNGILVWRDGKLRNLRAGAKLAEYRLNAGLTQAELGARLARRHPDIWKDKVTARNYISQVENGGIDIPSPLKINPLHEELGYPGWELLELIGYDTDGDSDSKIEPELRSVAIRLAPVQQKLLAKFGRDLLAAGRNES